jgi:hypothetical protein
MIKKVLFLSGLCLSGLLSASENPKEEIKKSIKNFDALTRGSSVSQQTIERCYTKVCKNLDYAVFSGSLDQDQYRKYCDTICGVKTKLDSRLF